LSTATTAVVATGDNRQCVSVAVSVDSVLVVTVVVVVVGSILVVVVVQLANIPARSPVAANSGRGSLSLVPLRHQERNRSRRGGWRCRDLETGAGGETVCER